MSRGHRVFPEKEEPIAVCPYQFRACEKAADETCGIKKELEGVKDVGQWARISNKAPYCEYTGRELTRLQYENRRIGVVV